MMRWFQSKSPLADDEWEREPTPDELLAREYVRQLRAERALEIRTRPDPFRLGPEPSSPGMYLGRRAPGLQWSLYEVMRAPDGRLWMGWEDYPARPIEGSRFQWLTPGLEVPR